MRKSHDFYMQAALTEAKQGLAAGEPPFGCVLVNETGEIVLQEHDRIRELGDMSAHAETLVVKRACATLGRNDLSDLTLYSTVEPCAMCFTTAWLNRIKGIVYGTSMEKVAQVTAGKQVEMLITIEEMNERSGSKVEITGGILSEACYRFFMDYEYH